MNQIFFKNKQRSKLPSLYYFYYIRKRKTFFKIDSAKKCTYIIIRLMIWKGGGDTAHAQAELDLDAGCKVQAAGDCLLGFFDEPTPITYFFLINRTKSRFYTNTMGANSVEACMVSLTVSTSASRFCDSALCGVYLWVLSKTSNLTEDLKLFVGVWVLVFLCDSRIHPISQLQLALLSATVHIFQLTFAHDANKKSTHAFLFLFFFCLPQLTSDILCLLSGSGAPAAARLRDRWLLRRRRGLVPVQRVRSAAGTEEDVSARRIKFQQDKARAARLKTLLDFSMHWTLHIFSTCVILLMFLFSYKII